MPFLRPPSAAVCSAGKLQGDTVLDLSCRGVAYPYRIVLKALAQMIGEQLRMRRAMRELGHVEATERVPKDLEAHLEQVERDEGGRIGTPEDPFTLHDADDRLVARYYLEADDREFRVHVTGSAAFLAAYEAAAQRDDCDWRH